ncbi:MAG: porin [Prosthecobacter sp.]|nr:porin [Prosthecobacter sp.]
MALSLPCFISARRLLLTATFALTALPALAGDATAPSIAPAPAPSKSVYDQIWGMAKLYKNEDNPFLQEFAIVGRQQNEWYNFNALQGHDDDAWVNRRSRIGFKAKMFETITLHAEADLNFDDPTPLYNKLTDAYIRWSPSKAFNLTVGKQGVKFTLDGATSSTALITIDRSAIGTNFWFPEEYIPGVSINGEVRNWIYGVGYFSSGTASPEFGNFNAGNFGLVNLGYNFAKELGLDKAILRADFLYQGIDLGNTIGTPNPFTRNSEMVGSLNFLAEKGRFGLGTDLVASKGYLGQPDLFGAQLMPSYYLNQKKTFQGVLRYTYINSGGGNGIRLGRYENKIVSGRGDEYNEIYAGLNWYIYGHKLKIQTGMQYASMKDGAGDGGKYDGWGVVTGVRVSW